MKKRVIAFLLMLVMLVSVLPMPAVAADLDDGIIAETEAAVVETEASVAETTEVPSTQEETAAPEETAAATEAVVEETAAAEETVAEETVAEETVVEETTALTFEAEGEGIKTEAITKYDHIDVRQAGAGFSITYILMNPVTGEVISSSTKTVNATVTGITSVTYTDVNGTNTWTSGFTNDGTGYEFRLTGQNFSTDLSKSSAVIVVELTDNDTGEVYENVKFTFGVAGCEQAVKDCDGYSQAQDGRGSVGLDFNLGTNTEVVIEYIKWVIPVQKIWIDNDDAAGKRPESITVELLANGETAGTAVLNDSNNWYHAFEDMDSVDENEELIAYTVKEIAVPDGYESVVNQADFTITNTLVVTDVSVSKVWGDAEDQDGKRPVSITVQLMDGDDAYGDAVTLNEENDWAYTWEDLPADGNYTVVETNVPDGYTSVVTGDAENGYVITNSHTPEQIEIEVTKIWSDKNNQDGIRPDSITVNLLANGEVVATAEITADENGDWKYTFTDLDKYADGAEIEYTVTEEAVAGYDPSIDGFIVTNTHEVDTSVAVSGSKTWADNSNQDGIRPESIKVTITGTNGYTDTKTVTAADNWAWSWTGLDKYYDGGKEVEYTISEEAVAGYETTVDGYNITNTHEVDKSVAVSGSKTWADNNDQDGVRPTSITVNLLANGTVIDTKTVTEADGWAWSWTGLDKFEAGVEITYTITEAEVAGYTTEVNGYNITNTHATKQTSVAVSKVWDDADNQDGIRPASITVKLLADDEDTGKTLTLNAENNWSGEFTDLDVYKNKIAIVYTVEEDAVDGYKAEIAQSTDGYSFEITNKHDVYLTSVSGAKTWDDADNQDGLRPEKITINLLADGVEVDEQVVTAESGWTWSFENLPVNKAGKAIVYSIVEDAVDGYTSTVNGSNVTNTHVPAVTEVTVTKVWDDNDNQDGVRPASVEVVLYADGEKVDSAEIKADEDGNWTYIFENLPVNKAGKEIVYTVAEVLDDDSTYVPTVDGFTITNTDAPDKTAVTVRKAWDDSNDQDGVRPTSITLALMANDKKVQDVVLTAEGGWTATVSDLDKYYDNGKEVAYTFIEESEIAEYKWVSTTVDEDGAIVVTNAHETYTTDVSVSKEWDDGDNQDGIRTESVEVSLYANGDLVETVKLSKSNKWENTWKDLPVNANGKAIEYTVVEAKVAGYEATYKTTTDAKGNIALTVVNTHEPETWVTNVTKVWIDNNDAAGKRPESVTVQLYKNGTKYGKSFKITEDGGWKVAVELPVYENGEKIEWTIKETRVPSYYTVKYDQSTLTVKNTVKTDSSPQTGDSFNVLLWSGLMGMSAMAAFLLLVSKKRNYR